MIRMKRQASATVTTAQLAEHARALTEDLNAHGLIKREGEQVEPSEQEIANAAMQFLGRVQLQGQEVPAFNTVMEWLRSKRDALPHVDPALQEQIDDATTRPAGRSKE